MSNNLQDFTVEELTTERAKETLEYQEYMLQHKNLSDKKVCQFKRELITKSLTIYFFGDTVINPCSNYPKEIIDKYYGHIVRLTDEMLRIQMEEPLFILRESPQFTKEKNIIFNKYLKKALINLNYDYIKIKEDIKLMLDSTKDIVQVQTNNMEENYTPKSR